MAFYADPGPLWIVRTRNSGRNHIAESETDGSRPLMKALCGCSVRPAIELRRVTDLAEIRCKRCEKAQRVYLMDKHANSGVWVDGVYHQKDKP